CSPTTLCGFAKDSVGKGLSGCEDNHKDACYNAAQAFRNGRGTERDPRRADLFRAACEHGSREACDSVGEAYGKGLGTKKRRDEAVKWYERACEMGNQTACRNAARLQEKCPPAFKPAGSDAAKQPLRPRCPRPCPSHGEALRRPRG
ncbi:MAG: tetratricopeptide repeat protein, partial [Myxococcota bacterium]